MAPLVPPGYAYENVALIKNDGML